MPRWQRTCTADKLQKHQWPKEKVAYLRLLRRLGYNTVQCAEAINTHFPPATKSSVIGKIHRLRRRARLIKTIGKTNEPDQSTSSPARPHTP
jgi:hypothetical protein